MQGHDAFEPCGACLRHVRREDAACPFCGAARRPSLQARPTARGVGRVSRAHWLAFGTTVVGIGCNTALVADRIDDVDASRADAADVAEDAAAIAHDANTIADARDDRAADAASAPAQDAELPTANASCPRSGTFACGTGSCNRASEYCDNGHCQPLANLPVAGEGGACGACPTCACIPPGSFCNCWQCSNGTCFQDNFGGIALTCSQGGCYGSPPARLERMRTARA